MIDLHSHILPGVDDGAKTLDVAFDMLKLSIDQGVKIQILTPHIHIGRYDNQRKELEKAFQRFRQSVADADLPIKLLLASEVRIGPEVIQLAKQDAIPCLGEYKGRKVFLLEFPVHDIPFGSENLVSWLLNNGYRPIIAHPERNSTFLSNRKKLNTFLDMGCLTQLTACSLTGRFGKPIQKMSVELLEQGKITVIASDCHNLKGRKPDLFTGFSLAKDVIGDAAAKKLVTSNPATLTKANSFH